MTIEEKKLLFKDLCARVPYGVQVKWAKGVFKFDEAHQGIGALFKRDENGKLSEDFDIIMSGCFYGEVIKPYLRPMSSMTEEERNEYLDVKMQECERVALAEVYRPEAISIVLDWLNEHHFGYRGLIEKGLALPAKEGMYETK